MDFIKIETLLNVIHLAAAGGPEYAWIAAAARDELQEMKAGPVILPAPPESTEPPVEPVTPASAPENGGFRR